MTPRSDEQGMILLNVLMFVAIASGLVLLMINREELALDRGIRTAEAARALAAARGGELSAVIALRRDGEEAPDADFAAEPWGKVGQTEVPIDGGSFALAIADAEGRYNINNVRSGEAGQVILFQTIAREIGLADEQITAAIEYVRLMGPVTDLRPLRMIGVDPKLQAQLERMVTALPTETTINLNAVDPELLAILVHDRVVAERLAAARKRKGFLDASDLAAENATMPWGTSFNSSSFWIHSRARIGTTTQELATLVQRRRDPNRGLLTEPVERWRGAAIPPGVPAIDAKPTT